MWFTGEIQESLYLEHLKIRKRFRQHDKSRKFVDDLDRGKGSDVASQLIRR